MKKELMSLTETTNAAMNMNSIESHLGHKIPAGMIDSTSLGDHLMSPAEVTKVAMSIQAIENEREALDSLSIRFKEIFAVCVICIGMLYLIVAIIIS